MGEYIFIFKWLSWLTNASICLHDIPKDAELQHLGGIFPAFFIVKTFQDGRVEG